MTDRQIAAWSAFLYRLRMRRVSARVARFLAAPPSSSVGRLAGMLPAGTCRRRQRPRMHGARDVFRVDPLQRRGHAGGRHGGDEPRGIRQISENRLRRRRRRRTSSRRAFFPSPMTGREEPRARRAGRRRRSSPASAIAASARRCSSTPPAAPTASRTCTMCWSRAATPSTSASRRGGATFPRTVIAQAGPRDSISACSRWGGTASPRSATSRAAEQSQRRVAGRGRPRRAGVATAVQRRRPMPGEHRSAYPRQQRLVLKRHSSSGTARPGCARPRNGRGRT